MHFHICSQCGTGFLCEVYMCMRPKYDTCLYCLPKIQNMLRDSTIEGYRQAQDVIRESIPRIF